MENHLVKQDQQIISENELISYLDVMGLAIKLNEKEKIQFLNIAKSYNLNPFKREIYCVKYKESDPITIITGYETYLKRAERQGTLDGWFVSFDGDGNNLKATITIHRKDRKYPVIHTVWYSEYVQLKDETNYVNGNSVKTGKKIPTKFWEKAHTMMNKVAIAQGFRLAFPDELGGMPYTADELPETHEVIDTPHEVIDTPHEVIDTPLKPTPQPTIDNHVHAINAIKKHPMHNELIEVWKRTDLPTQSHPAVIDELVSSFFTWIDCSKSEQELKSTWTSIGLYGKEFQLNNAIVDKKDAKKNEFKPVKA